MSNKYQEKAEQLQSNPVTIILTLGVTTFLMELVFIGNVWAIQTIGNLL